MKSTKKIDLLEKGWVPLSTSQYNHPLFFHKKKKSTLYMYIDFRVLFKNSTIVAYPILYTDNIFYHWGAVIFSKTDLSQGYHQVQIAKGYNYRTTY